MHTGILGSQPSHCLPRLRRHVITGVNEGPLGVRMHALVERPSGTLTTMLRVDIDVLDKRVPRNWNERVVTGPESHVPDGLAGRCVHCRVFTAKQVLTAMLHGPLPPQVVNCGHSQPASAR